MKKTNTNNKGFSLVELIIVIAIMAILIGVLAPQYMKYVDKSRVSADKDLLDSVCGACTTAASDPDYATAVQALTSSTLASQTDLSASIATGNDWGEAVLDTLGAATFQDVEDKLKSKDMAGQNIVVIMDANGNFYATVNVTDPAASAAGATYTNYCVPQQY